MSGPADFDRLGDLLGEAGGVPPRTTRGGPGDRDAEVLAVIWPEVVGDEVAANARPVQLKQGRLVVSASSSAWAQTLQLMGDAVAARINERMGERVVEEVVFRHAGWEERSAGRPVGGPGGRVSAGRPSGGHGPGQVGEGGALSAEQTAALAEVEALDLSPELRDKIAHAMEAAFVRAQQDSVR
jgi:hypothetical protein